MSKDVTDCCSRGVCRLCSSLGFFCLREKSRSCGSCSELRASRATLQRTDAARCILVGLRTHMPLSLVLIQLHVALHLHHLEEAKVRVSLDTAP